MQSKTEKRSVVVARLQSQLNRGVKPSEKGDIPLTKEDKSRILKEIKVLENRIKNPKFK